MCVFVLISVLLAVLISLVSKWALLGSILGCYHRKQQSSMSSCFHNPLFVSDCPCLVSLLMIICVDVKVEAVKGSTVMVPGGSNTAEA